MNWIKKNEIFDFGQYFYNFLESKTELKTKNSECLVDLIKKDNGLDNIYQIVCSCKKCLIKRC